ncbi:MAG: 30S ribosomal protein S21 [Bacteroidetes bacterium]|nr:30S ribosomal protein S21 [Rhodothermia bacterium]MCS7154307.1 30S ribosomal protein S21 [Bacteroidota bacterium]MCX7906657.1 30S ribosomal protein S21 [Bacteroidota bacterium]MDW8137063.1 30S ribosomal protein S21 [Bacteroidota bacterium]MDW8285066.1 30S ribosomal protein S21 [Bacteroidota bacterium]
MIGIQVREGEPIDKALRRFKKKYERSGILREYKRRTAYVKPSEERRLARIKAIRRLQRALKEQEP